MPSFAKSGYGAFAYVVVDADLDVDAYVCLCICMCVYLYLYVCVYIPVCVHRHIYVHMYIYVSVCVSQTLSNAEGLSTSDSSRICFAHLYRFLHIISRKHGQPRQPRPKGAEYVVISPRLLFDVVEVKQKKAADTQIWPNAGQC